MTLCSGTQAFECIIASDHCRLPTPVLDNRESRSLAFDPFKHQFDYLPYLALDKPNGCIRSYAIAVVAAALRIRNECLACAVMARAEVWNGGTMAPYCVILCLQRGELGFQPHKLLCIGQAGFLSYIRG